MVLRSIKRHLLGTPIAPFALALNRLRSPKERRAQLARSDRYDMLTVRAFQRMLKRDSCCVDVGAHAGDILWHMVDLAPEGKHFAFEPIASFAQQLKKDFPGVTVFNKAVSNTAGTANFVLVANDPAYSGLLEREYDRSDPVLKHMPVEMVRLDDILGDVPVRLIKLDIEGGELNALKGATRTLERCHPAIVLEAGLGAADRYGVTPEIMFDFFQKLDYGLWTLDSWLSRQPSMSLSTFCGHWHSRDEFYFIAHA